MRRRSPRRTALRSSRRAQQLQPPPAAADKISRTSSQRADNPSTLRAIPDGPGKRVAELQGLDKVTARTQRFYAPVGETTRFGTLDIKVGDCMVNTPDAPPEAAAYLTIIDHKPGQSEQKLFAGWMFASTPALSAMDDGVYDVRVLGLHDGCRDPRRPSDARNGRAGRPPRRGCTRNSSRGISIAPKLRRCSVMNWQSSSRNPPLISRATRWTSATFEASRSRLNMLSPKNAAPTDTP